MIVDCAHFKDVGANTWGECGIGAYHQPSAGTCTRCLKRTPRQQDFEETPEQVRVELKRGGCGCSAPRE